MATFVLGHSLWFLHAGLCGNGLLMGPIFFEGNTNGQVYLDMINDNVVPILAAKFQQFGLLFKTVLWWIQDGAPPNRRIMVRERLHELVGNRVVALNEEIEWPARSPDLTPCEIVVRQKLMNVDKIGSC